MNSQSIKEYQERQRYLHKRLQDCEARLRLSYKEKARLPYFLLIAFFLSLPLLLINILWAALLFAAGCVVWATAQYLNFFQLRESQTHLDEARKAYEKHMGS